MSPRKASNGEEFRRRQWSERSQSPSSQQLAPEVARRQSVRKPANLHFESRRLHQPSLAYNRSELRLGKPASDRPDSAKAVTPLLRRSEGGIGPFLRLFPPSLRPSSITQAESRSRRKALAITTSETPMSAAMAAHNDAKPQSVSATKTTFTPIDRVMFCLMIPIARREWFTSHGNRDRSSAISAMSAVSMAASLPAAPMATPSVARAIAGASFTPSPIMATLP